MMGAAVNISWFKDLGNLAQTGNFSQAAQLGNVSQPAFSRRIRALEAWVGATLVDRSRQPVRLTAAGRQMLEAGQQALSRIETERTQVREALAQPDRYVVTFATQHSIGWRFYPAWLQALENAFGPIMSRLRADDLPNCLEDLEKGEVDFVISYQSDVSSGVAGMASLESLKIGQDALVPVCQARADGAPLFNVDDHRSDPIPFLRFGPSAPIGEHVEPLLQADGIGERLRVVYENTMAGALRVRARDGAGVAWLPRSLVRPDLEAGLLALAGGPRWSIELEIRLHRLNVNTNQLTRKIWTFLALREGVPLVADRRPA